MNRSLSKTPLWERPAANEIQLVNSCLYHKLYSLTDSLTHSFICDGANHDELDDDDDRDDNDGDDDHDHDDYCRHDDYCLLTYILSRYLLLFRRSKTHGQ